MLHWLYFATGTAPRHILGAVAVIGWLASGSVSFAAEAGRASAGLLQVLDHAGDDGTHLDVAFETADPAPMFEVQATTEAGGIFRSVLQIAAPAGNESGAKLLQGKVGQLRRGQPYWLRVRAVDNDGTKRVIATTKTSVRPMRDWYDSARLWFLLISISVCGAVVWYIAEARRGTRITIRKIAGLEALEDAVGRATETGRACLFVPGIQDINEIQTIAGLVILGHVAQRAADYDCELICPTSKSLVMTAARETVAAAYYSVGRPDAYREDSIYYVTDEQFGYVAHLTGRMVREEPAACFYMGSFYAESLILAEVGNAVGAIQIAGTAQPSQLPFFVAACDYTLIGEEFFAASAYLSGDPDQLGSLKGQDLGKVLTVTLMLIGAAISTLAAVTASPLFDRAADYFVNSVLNG